MLPFPQRIAFLIFAAITGSIGLYGFYRLYLRIKRGRADTDARTNNLPRRVWYALITTLTQSRTFRKRPWVSFFHSFIFYGFTFYLLVNLLDAVDGFYELPLTRLGLIGNIYVLFADVLSALVLVGVIALVIRRFALPSRNDFTFNERTMLHKDVQQKYITFDSIFVSTFILFHVGSRAVGAGAKLALEGPDHFAPFATLVSHLFTPANAPFWRDFGYWGALASVLAFLAYFPYSKHLHIFMAPAKYLVARDVQSGVLPAVVLDMEAEEPKLGAANLEDLAWPRLIDAYACIQCNRCQDVCPATATGKSLSPSALEINKRMELNDIARHEKSFESGAPSPRPLLKFALSEEAAWACTTCGACIDVCPVGDEPMLDIIDIRRQQVMIEGEFPAQLQSAFRGMERAKNPWGINHEKRLDWAEGLNVKTTDQNPTPDVLFWVGCAAAYDPQSQKTARAFVQLLDHAGVDFAVLGKRECCTGDSARRAGNEYLYRQLADENVSTLNEVRPKLIVATCPHCLNAVGKEYKQIGGDYKVMHHTEYLETLVSAGKLVADAAPATVAYHDPCYLGRHNGIYDAPRNLLNILSNDVLELPRNKENSFCCGAGGAQFWKEEEPGDERISDNRYREAQTTLANGKDDKVLAVGCPFCKSMLESTPGKGEAPIAVRDVAELLLEGVLKKSGKLNGPQVVTAALPEVKVPVAPEAMSPEQAAIEAIPEPSVPAAIALSEQIAAEPAAEPAAAPQAAERKKWSPKAAPAPAPAVQTAPDPAPEAAASDQPKRKAWAPKAASTPAASIPAVEDTSRAAVPEAAEALKRKAWTPKQPVASPASLSPQESAIEAVHGLPEPPASPAPGAPRKAWNPKKATETPAPEAAGISTVEAVAQAPEQPAASARKAWSPKAPVPKRDDPEQ